MRIPEFALKEGKPERPVDQRQRRRLKPLLLEASDGKSSPVVYGEYNSPGAAKIVIVYAHYDGQPTDHYRRVMLA